MGTLRRAKDIATRSNRNAANLILNEKPDWQAQAPVYITYYQVNDKYSSQDYDLENTHSLLGSSTPIKYNKITDVPLYGVDTLQIQNEINERGLVSSISGEGFFLPKTIEPRAGEFFVFDIGDPSFDQHLFQITDVQQSHATAYKYFQIQYVLYHENVSIISQNVLDDYTLMYDSTGSSTSAGAGDGIGVIKKATAVYAESVKKLVDSIVEDYIKDYFDDEVNYFVYKTEIEHNPVYLWSGYLQHFLCKNKVIDFYNKKIMTDIYLLDIDNHDNANAKIYSEAAYRKSLFKAVETQSNCLDFDRSLLQVVPNVLRTRNLPFFCSTAPYALLDFCNHQPGQSLNMWPLITGDETKLYGRADQWHRFVNADDFSDDNNSTEYQLHINAGDIIYQTNNTEYPIGAYYIYPTKVLNNPSASDVDDALRDPDGIAVDVNLETILDDDETYFTANYDNHNRNLDLLFKIVKDYINDKFVLDEQLIKDLNHYNYDITAKNYILVPLVVYILKEKINEILG